MLAIDDYEAAIRIDPQYGRAYNNRGTAYRGIGQYERAVQDFDEAIRLNPEDGTAYANRALTFTYLNLDTAAQQDVERAVGVGFSRDLVQTEIEEIKALR